MEDYDLMGMSMGILGLGVCGVVLATTVNVGGDENPWSPFDGEPMPNGQSFSQIENITDTGDYRYTINPWDEDKQPECMIFIDHNGRSVISVNTPDQGDVNTYIPDDFTIIEDVPDGENSYVSWSQQFNNDEDHTDYNHREIHVTHQNTCGWSDYPDIENRILNKPSPESEEES